MIIIFAADFADFVFYKNIVVLRKISMAFIIFIKYKG